MRGYKTIEEKLPENRFVRVHKSFLVAINRIDLIRKQKIKIGDKLIPIGETYRSKVYNMLEINNPILDLDYDVKM